MEEKADKITTINEEKVKIDIVKLFTIIDSYVRASIKNNNWDLLDSNTPQQIHQEEALKYSVKINNLGIINFYYRLKNYCYKDPYAAWQFFRKELRTDFGIIIIMANNSELYNFVEKYTGLGTNVSEDKFGSTKKLQVQLSKIWDCSEQRFNLENYCQEVKNSLDFFQRLLFSNPPIRSTRINISGAPVTTSHTMVGATASIIGSLVAGTAGVVTSNQFVWLRNFTIGGHSRFLDTIPEDLPKEFTVKLQRSAIFLKQKLLKNITKKIEGSYSALAYNEIVTEDKLLPLSIKFLNKVYDKKFPAEFSSKFCDWSNIHKNIKNKILNNKSQWKLKFYSHITNLKGNYQGTNLEGAEFWLNTFALTYVSLLIFVGLSDNKKSRSLNMYILPHMDKEKFKEDVANIITQLYVSIVVRTVKDSLDLKQHFHKSLENCKKHDFRKYTKLTLNAADSLQSLNSLVDILYKIYEEDGGLHLLAGYDCRLNKTSTGSLESYKKNTGSHAICVVLNKENRDCLIFNSGGGWWTPKTRQVFRRNKIQNLC